MVNKTQDEKTKEIWIENCTNFQSRFSSDRGDFELKPQGQHGSIISVDERLGRDTYIMRAIQRNKIRILSDQDAMEKVMELVEPPDEGGHQHRELLKYLSEGASDITDRYQKKLPEEAEPSGRRMSPEEIFGVENSSQAAQSKTVTRADQQPKVIIEPVLGKSVLKPKMYEGDLPEIPQI